MVWTRPLVHMPTGVPDWVLFEFPEPTIVGFCDLVEVGIGPLSKKLGGAKAPPAPLLATGLHDICQNYFYNYIVSLKILIS